MSKRVTDMSRWRSRRAKQRYAAPPKDSHVYASTDELLAARLRRMRLPEPPPAVRERNRASYSEWLNSQPSRNRWR